MRWFGQVPSFHDAEILSLHLHRKGPSVLRLHGWINTGEVGQSGYFVLDRHAVVTFTLSEVMDLPRSPMRYLGRLFLLRSLRSGIYDIL